MGSVCWSSWSQVGALRDVCQSRSDFQAHKDSVLSVLVDKVTNVGLAVPEAWGITTKM